MLKKMNNQLHILTIIGTIAALAFMITFNYLTFKANATKNIEDIGVSSLAQVTEQLEGYLSTGMNVVETTSETLEYMIDNGAEKEEVINFLRYKTDRYKTEIDSSFTGIYGYFYDDYLDGLGWTPGPDFIPTQREWYLVAKEAKGRPALVSPYLDAQTGTIMMSISKLFPDGTSVISLDITLDEIQEITQEICLNGRGYGFVVDKNGLVVAHNDINEKGKNYLDDETMSPVLNRIYKERADFFEIEIGKETYTVFSNSVMTDWYVVMIVSNEKLYHDVDATLTRNIIIGILISVFIIFFYIYAFKQIEYSSRLERESKQRIEEMNRNVIQALVRTIDAKDRYTNGHSIRVADYAKEVARRMNKSEDDQEKIYYSALLHDVGKIRVPEEVINKSDGLTAEEYEQIKVHPVTGFHILKDIYEDKTIANGALFHHERYDGHGYPRGLVGEEIPEVARIIGVVDTYDAMASNRSYRRALPQDVISNEIKKGRGSQFDPKIADIMLQMIDDDKGYTMREGTVHTNNELNIPEEIHLYDQI